VPQPPPDGSTQNGRIIVYLPQRSGEGSHEEGKKGGEADSAGAASSQSSDAAHDGGEGKGAGAGKAAGKPPAAASRPKGATAAAARPLKPLTKPQKVLLAKKQADALRTAAAHAVPFCEECARAAGLIT